MEEKITIRLFISYRREDTAAITGRLCDRLKERFGSDQVFVDIDDIPYGVDFVNHIHTAIRQSDLLLAVIGPNWRGKLNGKNYLLDNPTDFVRIELEYAFSQELAVFPILVLGTNMPLPVDLPKGLRKICTINAAPLDIGRDFHTHADRICSAVEDIAARVKSQSLGANAATPLALSTQAMSEWFTVFTGGGTPDVEYKCKNCGFTGWIEKLHWFRDGERPPMQCPKCKQQGTWT